MHLPEPETGHRLCVRHHHPGHHHVLWQFHHEGARDRLRRVRHHPGGGVLMAPPIPLESRRTPRRHRSTGDILAGVGAVLLLLVLLVGVPVVLVRLLGSPIPHSMPALSVLTHRLDTLAVLRILSVVVWLAWLQLIVCVIAEVRAAVRNTGMPSRVPLAGGMQPIVHRLVTAALLLFSAATALSPPFAQPAPPRPGGPGPPAVPRGRPP